MSNKRNSNKFCYDKNTNKRVIVKTTTYWPLTEVEKQNVVMVVSTKTVFCNNKKNVFC